MKYLLTYEDALLMCEAYKNFNFYKTETLIEGYKVVTFNYFMCEYEWFNMPLREKPEVDAYDMRGTTFVFNKDGSLFNRYFMLRKFFNLNQVPSSQYDVIKDKKIKYITEKEDGSLVAFMKLPNGNIFCKTQGGFDNEMCVNSMKILKSDYDFKNSVDSLIGNYEFTPMFEYVSYDNRIVLRYHGTGLRFIGVRNNKTGEWGGIEELINAGVKLKIPCVNTVVSTLDELIERAKTEKDREGWVIEFDDGSMIKVKTVWYWNLHYVRTENIFREDYIAGHILRDTVDDLVSQLDVVNDADAFEFIKKVKGSIVQWSEDIDDKVYKLLDSYYEFKEDWNKFATEKHKEAFFGLVKPILSSGDSYKKCKVNYMLHQTYRLNEARRIIDKWSK